MKIIKLDLNKQFPYLKEAKEIKIIPIADVHLGDSMLDEKLLKDTIEKIKNDKFTFCVLNGDLVNNAIKNSVSNVYEETMTPMEQTIKLIEILKPIKDKILCADLGNHCARTLKETSIDMWKTMSYDIYNVYKTW